MQAYGPGVHGIHVGKKIREGDQLPFYSIVFMVTRKRATGAQIPAWFAIPVRGARALKVPTDVIVTDSLQELSVQQGTEISDTIIAGANGAIGFFCTNNGMLFACTNAHVIARPYRSNGVYQSGASPAPYPPPAGPLELWDAMHVVRGRLWRSVYGPVDAALAWIPRDTPIDRSIPGIGKMRQPYGPPQENWRHGSIAMYSRMAGRVMYGQIYDPIAPPLPMKLGRDLVGGMLIKWNRGDKAYGGDSGSAIIGPGRVLLGILVGTYPAKNPHDPSLAAVCPIKQVISQANLNVDVLHNP